MLSSVVLVSVNEKDVFPLKKQPTHPTTTPKETSLFIGNPPGDAAVAEEGVKLDLKSGLLGRAIIVS